MVKIGVFVPFRNVRAVMRIGDAIVAAERLYRAEKSRKNRIAYLRTVPPEELLGIIEDLTLYLSPQWRWGCLATMEYSSTVAKCGLVDENQK